MATAAQSLDTAIANVSATIASITASPKPSYSVDGEQVSWGEYLDTLTNQLNVLMKSRQDLDGAWIQTQRGLG
jgi:hypothetical protein